MQFIFQHTDDRFFLIENVNISVRGEPDLEEGDVFRLTVPLIYNSSEKPAIEDEKLVIGKNLKFLLTFALISSKLNFVIGHSYLIKVPYFLF